MPRLSTSELSLISVSADAIAHFRKEAIDLLAIVADTNIPLDGGHAARFVVFRDAIGGSAVAVIIGMPDCSKPVPVRLHSACLTGDVFGSRRCDCGDQLRLSLRLARRRGRRHRALPGAGGARARPRQQDAHLSLQDAGLDTLDANAALGFDSPG